VNEIPIDLLRQNARVLVAEDNERMARALTRLLSGGFEVVAVVRNGKDAIKATIELRPQIMVLDVLLPLCDGIQVLRQLRSEKTPCKFVVVTGLEGREFADAALAAGAQAYVTKRRISADLMKAMKAVLEGRSFVSELGPDKAS
jgi:DNA-binding NarL/FixJ family response regulator